MQQKLNTTNKRLAWAITGSGHYLRECLDILQTLSPQQQAKIDIFLSRAAAEIMQQYGFMARLNGFKMPIFTDKTASSVPVEWFYQGKYHTLVIAPATSNTIAKMALGISDSLVTNLYAQAGKTRMPSIIFACDTVPAQGENFIESEAPRDNLVQVYPRQIDLQHVANLAKFEVTQVVADMQTLQQAVLARL